MPTKPIEDLLPLDLPPDIQETLSQLSDAIAETVYFGAHVLKWCANSEVRGNEHAPVFLSFRHILEMLDAISALVKNSIIEPSNLLLRSIFETLLNIEYLLKDNLEHKAKDFMFWYLHERLKFNTKILNDIKSGRDIDPTAKEILAAIIQDILEDIRELKISLDHPDFSNSKIELERYKGKNKGRFPTRWFNLRSGPQNISGLADILGKTYKYNILYKEWSKLSHGMGIFQGKFSQAQDGMTKFTQLRLPGESGMITSFSIMFALEAFRLMLNNYAKDKIPISKEWYIREIREIYLNVLEKEPITILDGP